MKRKWILIALILAGSSVSAALPCASIEAAQIVILESGVPYQTVRQVLKKASPELSITFEDLMSMYDRELVQIELLGGGSYEVSLEVDGNPVVILIEEGL